MFSPRHPIPLTVFGALALACGLPAQQPNGGRLDHLFDVPATPNNLSELELIDIEDLNGDGVPELLLAQYEAQALGFDEAGVVDLLDGASRSLLHRWTGSQEEQEFGIAVEVVPDQDGDGLQDVLIGSEGWNSDSGRVELFSSAAPFSRLATWNAIQNSEGFGAEVRLLGDLNGDLSPEIAVGAPYWSGVFSNSDGRVYIYELSKPAASGLLYTLDGDVLNPGWVTYGELGRTIEAATDLDFDSVPDLLVAAPGDEDTVFGTSGNVYAVSGATGSEIWSDGGSSFGDTFGWRLQQVDDVNGDGVGEFLVAAPLNAAITSPSGIVYLYSGADGDDLLEIIPEFDFGRFGEGLGAADFDLDGVRDFIIGAPVAARNGAARVGCIEVYSGADFSLLYRQWGERAGSLYGINAHDGVDRNGDGYPEILSWSFEMQGVTFDPRAWVLSGRLNPQVVASDDEVSLSAGGTVAFNLNFSADAAFYAYQVLYSGSGTGPVSIQGLPVPLGYDLNLVRSYLGDFAPYESAFLDMAGLLDNNGRATARLRVPAGAPGSLSGVTLHFAGIARAVWGDWEFSTVAAPVTFRP